MRPFILFLAALVPALAADPFTGRVVAVHDGDTITVEAPGHIIKVRLFGIDCPEAKQDDGAQVHVVHQGRGAGNSRYRRPNVNNPLPA